MLQPGSIHGQWRFERRIGKGGFGAVSLWINQSQQKIVIKQCIMKLNTANRTRWEAEVALMNETHHENLVTGIPVPQEIVAAINAPEKLLGLEFCDSDLRKVLSNVHHCCGLQEKMVLGVLKDISSGLEFLHSKNIMHRDLKPENILLKQTSNGTIFKIADLGYAKQMDAMSICQSFVGTLQYLAPELYQGTYNGYAADYWSFGTLIFECITGTRPFYLTEKASQWPILIATKSDADIWGRYDEIKKTVVFYRDITLPNHLCQPLLEKFKEFLQMVLRHSPDRRGSNPLEPEGPAEWFYKVKSVLKTKIISLFDVHGCEEISYVVDGDPNATFLDVKHDIVKQQKESEFSVKDFVLLTKNGKAIDNKETLESYFRNGNYKLNLFVFCKRRRSKRRSTSELPDRLREFLGEEETVKNIQLLKRMMYQAYHYCCTAYHDYLTLLSSFDALIHNMEELKDIILQGMLKNVTKLSIKLETSIDMYHKSLEIDKTFIQVERCTETQREALIKWDTIDAELKMYVMELNSWKLEGDLQNSADVIKNLSNNASIKEEGNIFQTLKEKSEEVLKRFKESSKDKKLEEQVNMIPIVLQCLEKRNSIKSFYDVLKKAMKCREEMSQMTEKLAHYSQTLITRHEQTLKWQKERQMSMWRLFRNQSLPGQQQMTSDFLVKYERKLEKHINQVCQPPVNELIRSFKSKLSRLHTTATGRVSPRRKSPVKSNTFDFPHERSQEELRLLDACKRRPSEPIPVFRRQPDSWSSSNGPDSGVSRVSNLSPIPSHENIRVDKTRQNYGVSNTYQDYFPKYLPGVNHQNSSNNFTDPNGNPNLKYFNDPSPREHPSPKELTDWNNYNYSKSPRYANEQQMIFENRQKSSSFTDSPKRTHRIASPQFHHIESVELDKRQASASKSATTVKREESEKNAAKLRNMLINPTQEKQPELHIIDHAANFQLQGHQGSHQQYPDILPGTIRHVSSSPGSLSNSELILPANNSPNRFHQHSPMYDRFMLPINNPYTGNSNAVDMQRGLQGYSDGRYTQQNLSPLSSPGTTRRCQR